MIHQDPLALNGLSSGSRLGEKWLEVSYAFPGIVDIEGPAEITLRSSEARSIALGRVRQEGRLTEAALLDPTNWEWMPETKEKTKTWVQQVMVANVQSQSRSYESEGDLVLVCHRLPPRAVEAKLWSAGFRSSLATFRARSTSVRQDLLHRVVERLAASRGWSPAPLSGDVAPAGEIKDRAQHVWMRWYAVFRDVLDAGGRTYRLSGRPVLTVSDGALMLRFRHGSSGSSISVRMDIASHPLFHDVVVEVDDNKLKRDALAWEDLPRLAEEIGEALAPRTRGRRGGKVSRSPAQPAAKEAKTATPRSSTTTWMQAVTDAFERAPGYRLEVTARGLQGHVVAIFPEGRGVEDAVVSIDLEDGEIEDVRWLSGRLTRTEQDMLLDRLGSAVMTANKTEKGESVSPIDDLIAMMERRGRILGADPDRTRIQDPQGHLARVLAELAEPSASTPAELMQWLERADFSAAADLVSKFRNGEGSGEVEALARELWKAAVGSLSVGGVRRDGGRWRVPCESLYTDKDGQVRLLNRRLLASGEYFLRPIAVRTVRQEAEGGITICEVVDEDESLLPDDLVYILEREPAEYIELHTRIRQFLAEVERTPERLQDVRRLLYWTAAMIETPRCQGAHRGAVRRAFAQAKEHYDDARLHLARGNPVVAFQRVHEALRRLSTATAAMAEACAEGQLPLTGPDVRGPSLEPSKADTDVLGELARTVSKARIGELRAVPEEPPGGQRGRTDNVILDGDIRYAERTPVPAGAKAVKWLRNLLKDIRPVVNVGSHEYRDPVVRDHGDVVKVVYTDNRSGRTLTLTAMPLAGYAGRPHDGPVLLGGEILNGTSAEARFSNIIIERTAIKDATDEDLKKWFATFVPPRVVHQVKAVYPVGVTSTVDTTVTLAVTVEADGRVGRVVVLASGGAAFDTAALDAVRQWRFNPARQGGAAVSAMIRVPVTFPAGQKGERDEGRERKARDEIDDLAKEHGMTREDYLAELEALELERMNAEGGARRRRRAGSRTFVYDPGNLLGKKPRAQHDDTAPKQLASVPDIRRGDSPDLVAHARDALTRAGINMNPTALRVVGRLGEYRAPNATARDLARRALRHAGIHASLVRDRLIFPLRQP